MDFLPPPLHAIALAGEVLRLSSYLKASEQRTVLLDPSAIDRPFLLQDSDIFSDLYGVQQISSHDENRENHDDTSNHHPKPLVNFNCIFQSL